MPRRARLSDNDPLSSTEEVLAGLEQFSKPTSQQPDKQTTQESEKSESQEAKKQTSRQPRKSTTSKSGNTASQEAEQLTSQQPENLTSKKVRKATFQLDDTVLQQLDRLHLELQLELGKTKAPYKEVLVEYALTEFLKQTQANRDELLEELTKLQQSRQK